MDEMLGSVSQFRDHLAFLEFLSVSQLVLNGTNPSMKEAAESGLKMRTRRKQSRPI